jgi:8-oxo-dGTP pyrophosphatase MutT (NUDIX family)
MMKHQAPKQVKPSPAGDIYSIYHDRQFSPSALVVFWQDQSLPLPGELQLEIERHWQELNGRGFFNGRLARLDSWQIWKGHLALFLRPTDYKTQLYSNTAVNEVVARWGEHALARALGISAVVISRDDQLVLMKRSDTVGEYPGRYDVFGGHIDCLATGPPDIFAAMAAELEEELGLKEDEIRLRGCGLISAVPIRKPELLFSARTRCAAEEIWARARTARDRHEYGTLETLPNRATAIGRFLKDHRDEISPSAYGCLAVYREQMSQHGRKR